jgi:hypothetical protein
MDTHTATTVRLRSGLIGALMLTEYADLHGLPPIRSIDVSASAPFVSALLPTTVQAATAWAEALEVEPVVTSDDGTRRHYEVTGSLHDVEIRLFTVVKTTPAVVAS